MLSIKGLHKSYRMNLVWTKECKALTDITLKIKKNEIISLLGENGAGKTTLISILTGLLKFNDGHVLIQPSKAFYKEILHDTSTSESGTEQIASTLNLTPINLIENRDLCQNVISVCPQYDLLWEDLTVKENMILVGRFKGISEDMIQTAVYRCLKKIHLFKKRNTFVKNLSRGTKRTVSIGLAILGNSELVILDEPTTGLDLVNRKAIWNIIRDLKSEGKTILLSTHIMDEADILSDRVVIINNGEIRSVSDTIEVKNQFKKLNLIVAVKVFNSVNKHLFYNLLTEVFGPDNFEVKYKSNTIIKINIPSDDERKVRQLVQKLDNSLSTDFTELEDQNQSKDTLNLKDFIESYELASLDLEEAYMMINEQHENAKEIAEQA